MSAIRSDLTDAGSKAELLALLLQEEGLASHTTTAVTPLPSETQIDAPLSFAQQRVWFLSNLEPQSPAYNVPIRLEISGALDLGILRQATTTLVRRHGILSYRFPDKDGEPIQTPLPASDVHINSIDLSGLNEEQRALRAAEFERAEALQPFDLSSGPAMRAAVIKLGDERYRLMMTIHHIACDDWSMRVIVRELLECYRAILQRREPELPLLRLQYADFARQQRQALSGPALDRLMKFWRPRLAGVETETGLPIDRVRGRVRSPRAESSAFPLGARLTGEIKSLAQGHGCTPYMAMLAALKCALCAFSGREDIVVGTPVAGRSRDDVQHMVGFFVNTVVMRTDIDRGARFDDVLKRVRETALSSFAHAEMPFELLVQELQLERDLASTPLFQVFFNMLPLEEAPDTADLPFNIDEVDYCDTGASKFDLTIYARQRGGSMDLRAVYNADLFHKGSIERLLRQYTQFIELAAAHPRLTIGQLMSRLPDAVAAVNDFNGTCRD